MSIADQLKQLQAKTETTKVVVMEDDFTKFDGTLKLELVSKDTGNSLAMPNVALYGENHELSKESHIRLLGLAKRVQKGDFTPEVYKKVNISVTNGWTTAITKQSMRERIEEVFGKDILLDMENTDKQSLEAIINEFDDEESDYNGFLNVSLISNEGNTFLLKNFALMDNRSFDRTLITFARMFHGVNKDASFDEFLDQFTIKLVDIELSIDESEKSDEDFFGL